MLRKGVFSCESTSGQYAILEKHPCSYWCESHTMLGNPAASNLNNSGTYLGDHWVDLETSLHSSRLSQQQAKFKDLLFSSLNVLSFFVKQPVALIPKIEINHLAVQKPDTRIALIRLSSIFWFLCGFVFFFFFWVIYVCVYTYTHKCWSCRILLFWARSLILRCWEVGVENGNQLSTTEARRDMCHWWGSCDQKLEWKKGKLQKNVCRHSQSLGRSTGTAQAVAVWIQSTFLLGEGYPQVFWQQNFPVQRGWQLY